jgi:hypothetical protein
VTKPFKVGDTVEIVVRFEKTQRKVSGTVTKLRMKGSIAEFETEGRRVTAFASQLVKVAK